jgi:hypothetical protein
VPDNYNSPRKQNHIPPGCAGSGSGILYNNYCKYNTALTTTNQTARRSRINEISLLFTPSCRKIGIDCGLLYLPGMEGFRSKIHGNPPRFETKAHSAGRCAGSGSGIHIIVKPKGKRSSARKATLLLVAYYAVLHNFSRPVPVLETGITGIKFENANRFTSNHYLPVRPFLFTREPAAPCGKYNNYCTVL